MYIHRWAVFTHLLLHLRVNPWVAAFWPGPDSPKVVKPGTGYKALKTKKPGGTRTQVKYEEKGVTLLMDLGTKVPYIHITVN